MSALIQELSNVISTKGQNNSHLTDMKLTIEKARGFQALSISDEEPTLYARPKKNLKVLSACEYSVNKR